MPEDGEVMDGIHKLEVAQATQVAAAAGTEATLAATQAGATATTAASVAGLAGAVASGADGFIVGIFLGMAIAKAKALSPSTKNQSAGSPSAHWGAAWAA